MSQNDFAIANQSAPDFRSDLNNALQALASLSSGATAPATTYANMLWYDTANNILKMRSEADDAWISIGYLDQSANAFRVLDDTQVVNTSGTQTGLIGDQATAAWEAGTGTTESLVSPAKVKAAVDQGFDNRHYKSSTISIANNGFYTFTHGLGGVPDITQVYLQCTTAEHGYSVGDIIQIIPWSDFEGQNEGHSVVVTSSAVEVRIGGNGPGYYTNKNLDSGVRNGSILTASRWSMYVVAAKFV